MPLTSAGIGTPVADPGEERAAVPVPPHRARRHRRVRAVVEGAAVVVVVVLVAIAVRSFVAEAYYIPSASMEPQLHIDDRVLVSRLAYDLHRPRRGDVVVFAAPRGLLPPDASPGNALARLLDVSGRALGVVDDRSVLIKRVIALPGETVEGRGGRLYVNGLLVSEPYLAPGTLTSTFGPVRVPSGRLWMMGDNRPGSEDSRIFGAVPVAGVVGRAVWRVWPPTRLSFLTVGLPEARPEARPGHAPTTVQGPTMAPMDLPDRRR